MRSVFLRASLVVGLVGFVLLALSVVSAIATTDPPLQPNAVFSEPTNSSPIVLSFDKAFVWSVNPDDDSVSVIRTDTDVEVQRFHVGQEPQSIALDPNNRYVYVANAADNSVSVISLTTYLPGPAIINGFVDRTFRTGAEPWNIVISPDGKRVYVSNSGQDTISVIQADAAPPVLIGNVDLRGTACNVGDPDRHFQPRGLAVNDASTLLYVTRFLSFVKPGGTQATDLGKEGVVCRMDIDTNVTANPGISNFVPITLTAHDSGFNAEVAYPNQLQSIVVRGTTAYVPNIATAPGVPLKFNGDTHAFVSLISGATGLTPVDGGAVNLHLGARLPLTGITRLFFANPWAMAFTNQSGPGTAYVVSAGSDLLVRLNVDAGGAITFTDGVSTTRYIDLNDPVNPKTSGLNAGKNPLGIVIRNISPANNKAYVMNYVSRNVTVVDLSTDTVSKTVALTNLPLAGTPDEQLQVGKEIFFSSRGNFDRPSGTSVSTANRLSSDGWQACSSCHFAGLTDGNVWVFNAGPRKAVPLNGTFSPNNPSDQRLLNYSAIFDEVEDFELNIRNVSGPGALATPVNGSTFDPNHGLLISDTGDINTAPLVVNAFAKPNANRPQLSVTLPGSTTAWPALTALKEWVRFGIRTPNGALTTSELTSGGGSATGGLNPTDVAQGRRLFFQQGCQACHGGTKWTISSKDFTSPPTDFATENPPITTTVNVQYIPRFLSNINSFNLNVAGSGNQITGTTLIGAIETAADGRNALGKDYDGNGTGSGYNIPSLLGIWQLPPYYHNGACETLNCVLANQQHRTANFTRPDRLSSAADQARVVAFLQSLDAQTVFPTNLSVSRHDIFLDPPTVFANTTITVGANVSLFGTRADLQDISNTVRVKFTLIAPGGATVVNEVPLPAFTQDFGQATVMTTWNVPNTTGVARVTVQADSTDVLIEANESDNTATRLVIVRTPPPDTTPLVVDKTLISDDVVFNENDPIVTTPNVKVLIVAHDPPPPATPSGPAQFCIVRYYYDIVTRRWVENTCDFAPLPAPDASSGGVFSYTVNATIPPFAGTAYAFVWVKDAAGNISRVPGFDVVSFIPATPITINRNDVRLFRIQTVPNQNIQLDFPIAFGDVDVSVFDNVTTSANRIAVSANNGTLTETVSFTNTFGANRVFQVEVRAIVNSRFTINAVVTQLARAVAANGLTGWPLMPDKDDPPQAPIIAGPPARQTAIDEPALLYLPLIVK